MSAFPLLGKPPQSDCLSQSPARHAIPASKETMVMGGFYEHSTLVIYDLALISLYAPLSNSSIASFRLDYNVQLTKQHVRKLEGLSAGEFYRLFSWLDRITAH